MPVFAGSSPIQKLMLLRRIDRFLVNPAVELRPVFVPVCDGHASFSVGCYLWLQLLRILFGASGRHRLPSSMVLPAMPRRALMREPVIPKTTLLRQQLTRQNRSKLLLLVQVVARIDAYIAWEAAATRHTLVVLALVGLATIAE
jgi:hypothetical protein